MTGAGWTAASEDKGWEAVVAALDTALVLRSLRGDRRAEGCPVPVRGTPAG